MDNQPQDAWLASSTWNRWDLHIHTPGTALNDQFKCSWDDYITAIESADPPVIALGITDYCTLETYKTFLNYWQNGKMQNVKLVIPNIEFRLGPQTPSGKAINAHILVDPSATDHVERTIESLRQLTVKIKNDNITCDHESLVRLGRLEKGATLEEAAALRAGIGQFKVDYTPFMEWYNKQQWLKRNSLLGIAGGKDGLAGLRQDGGFRQRHDEVIRSADFVFSGQPSDRDYFLGYGPDDKDKLTSKFDGLRACIHGSDAHQLVEVLNPDLNRYCWIKAAPTFDGLRQIVYEPEERVMIGKEPTSPPDDGRIIESITIQNHNGWFETESLVLSPYLNTVIGEKGTGKTALADLIAAAAGAWEPTPNSFLSNAKSEIGDAKITLRWADGRSDPVTISELADLSKTPEVRYLSQQFVERLCTGDVMADELVEEVERVIFDRIPPTDRMSASNLAELRHKETGDLRTARDEIRVSISELNGKIEEYRQEIDTLSVKQADTAKLDTEIARISALLNDLLKGEDTHSTDRLEKMRAELSELEDQVSTKRETIRKIKTVEGKLDRLSDQITDWFRDANLLLAEIGLTEDERKEFRPTLSEKADAHLQKVNLRVEAEIGRILGDKDQPTEGTISRYQADIKAEEAKLKLSEERAKKVSKLQTDLQRTKSQMKHCQAEIDRITKIRDEARPAAQKRRTVKYLEYFNLLTTERTVLERLYSPLREELSSRRSHEKEFELDVGTSIDIESWAEQGESMLDLRRSSLLSHRGTLELIARNSLCEAWRSGNSDEIKSGLDTLIKEITKEIPDGIRTDITPQDVADWIFSVDHIQLEYVMKYRGTELRYLSPGTRGIVLLILYLALDVSDNRPIVVDQPEENLDNASVFDVLVDYFRQGKQRRQIIMVTHNPNLVVNTDAERVIVASATRDPAGSPRISYQHGPLESSGSATNIKDLVCEILEGGKEAFRKRELRYGLDTRIE